MKYCGRFSNKINMNVFEEISIYYDKQNQELISFAQEHINQRIILIIRDIHDFYESQEWIKLNAIHDKFPELNLTVCFNDLCKFDLFSEELAVCKDSLDIPYFTGYLVTNFEQLHYLLQEGVSDVYLVENICFDLLRAKRVCSNLGVQIRVFPNVAQAYIKASPAHKKFFIRPEDVAEYEDVVDVLEFWGPLDRQFILHKIYTKGTWFGDLKELILDLDISFDSRCIMPEFARIRKNCRRKCMKGERCSACDHILNISRQLLEEGLMIKSNK